MLKNVTTSYILPYAGDSKATKTKPGTTDYGRGVEVLFTMPAKWWNWIMNKITTIAMQNRADHIDMLTEMQNAVKDADITLDTYSVTQLNEAVDIKARRIIDNYADEQVTEVVDGVTITHFKNKPYVIGHTLYLPKTQIL